MTLLDCYLFLDRVLQRCRASCTLACARGTYSYHDATHERRNIPIRYYDTCQCISTTDPYRS